MAFNKLRRQIEQESGVSYPTPAEKIMAQARLLTLALSALGGPVENHRPVAVTVTAIPVETTPAIPTGTIEFQRGDVIDGRIVGLIDGEYAAKHIIQGRDTGDESEYEAGLGEVPPCFVTRPEDCP